MRALLLLLAAWGSLSQESRLEVFVGCRTPEIFVEYRNANFRQELDAAGGGLNVRIRSRSLGLRHLNHRPAADPACLAALGPGMRGAFASVRANALTLAEILRNISLFLNSRIAYDEAELPQEAEAVLAQGRGHCVGYANVAQGLLACAGVSSRPVNGFYLREKAGRVEPVPHRWLEVDLPGGRRVFYDPQYQDFSSRYLVTRPGLVLERVERFAGVVVGKSKKIVDE